MPFYFRLSLLLVLLVSASSSHAQGIGQEAEELPHYRPDNYQQLLLNRSWRFTLKDSAQFRKADYSDKHWTLKQTGPYWRDVRNQDFWVRQSFYLPLKPYQASQDSVVLDLGRIDDADVCYLNGKQVGKSGTFPPKHLSAWQQHRFYKIHVNDTALKWGAQNTIAIKAYNQGNVGGLNSRWQRVLVPKPIDYLCVQLPGLVPQWQANPSGERQRQTIYINNAGADTLRGQLIVQLRRVGTNASGQTLGQATTLLPGKTTALSFQIPIDAPARWYAIVAYEQERQTWIDTVSVAIVTPPRPKMTRPTHSQAPADSLYLLTPVVTRAKQEAITAVVPPCNLQQSKLDEDLGIGTVSAKPVALTVPSVAWSTLQASIMNWLALAHRSNAKDLYSAHETMMEQLSLAKLAGDSILLWQAGNLLMGLQRGDGSLRLTAWSDYELAPGLELQQAQIAALALEIYQETGYDPWLQLAKGLTLHFIQSVGPLAYQTNLGLSSQESVRRVAAWVLPLAMLDELEGSKRNESWRNAAYDLIRKLDEGNGPRTVGSALSLASHAPYLMAEPVAYLMSLRGIWRLSIIHGRGIWRQAIMSATEDLQRFLVLNQPKLEGSSLAPAWTTPAAAAEITALYTELSRWGGSEFYAIPSCGLYKAGHLKWLFINKSMRNPKYAQTAYYMATRVRPAK